MKLKEFVLDIPYIKDEKRLSLIQKEHGLSYREAIVYDYNTNHKDKKAEFRYQTRCMCSMIERIWEPIDTPDCWKIMIECIKPGEDVSCDNLPEISYGKCFYNYDDFFNKDNETKKIIALELLYNNVPKVMESKGWDSSTFKIACEAVRNMNYNNVWVWKKKKRKNVTAEILLDHGVEAMNIFMQFLNQGGDIIQKDLLISLTPDEFIFAPYLGKLVWLNEGQAALVTKKGMQYIAKIGDSIEVLPK